MELEQQLRVALAPTRPDPRMRAAVMARLAGDPASRLSKRWIPVGSALALGAAAAMLAFRLSDPPTPVPMVHAAPEEGQPLPTDPIGDPSPEAAVKLVPAKSANVAEPSSAKAKPFIVQVMPLENEVTDPARKAAIESVYALLVSGLRSVPNVTFLVMPAADDATLATPDYRLTLTGSANPAIEGDDYVVRLVSASFRAGRESGRLHTSVPGDASPGCSTPPMTDVLASTPPCGDPEGVAAMLLSILRKRVFPPDSQFQRRLEERLADSKLESTDRLQALADLASLGRSSGQVGPRDFPAGLRDPAVVRAAIQLASSAPDPATRAQVWNTLRGSTDPQLVSPLVVALQGDQDDDTRIQALATLVAGFAADGDVRAAIQVTAAEDRKPMMRALAQRALGAESVWTEYVVSSLKNAQLPAQERIEAFFYAYGLQTTRNYGIYSADGRILRMLDDAAIRALSEVIPKAARESAAYARASMTLVSELAQLKHPAVTDLLLAELTASDSWYDPSWAIEVLSSRIEDPKVRATLQKVADESPRPQVRALAASLLSGGPRRRPGGQPAVVAAPTPAPPRLGLGSDYVKAGQGVPADLVGKLVVTNIATGGPAHQAGIREGDILLEVGGKAITSGPQLLEVLDVQPRNQDVGVLVSRDGQVMRMLARF